MHVHSEGYASRYAAHHVRAYARAVADVICEIMHKTGAEAVVVTGNSGISIAMAALMLADFPLVLVRKASDITHGQTIEGPEGTTFRHYLVLDDFVVSGSTIANVHKSLCKHDPYVECVGVVQYRQDMARKDNLNLNAVDSKLDETDIPMFIV